MRSKANRRPPVAATVHLADGVEYETTPGAPAPSFGCVPYRARLLTTACSKRWRQAQVATGWAAEQIERCRGCAIGAAHAGEKTVRYSTLYDSPICPRCGRGSARRLVGGNRCISCFNREREYIRGKNAKGSKPVHAIPLHRRTVRYAVEGGDVQDLTIPHSRDLVELMLTVLRTKRGRPSFYFTGQAPAGKTEAT
jgi:hypothetical protein